MVEQCQSYSHHYLRRAYHDISCSCYIIKVTCRDLLSHLWGSRCYHYNVYYRFKLKNNLYFNIITILSTYFTVSRHITVIPRPALFCKAHFWLYAIENKCKCEKSLPNAECRKTCIYSDKRKPLLTQAPWKLAASATQVLWKSSFSEFRVFWGVVRVRVNVTALIPQDVSATRFCPTRRDLST